MKYLNKYSSWRKINEEISDNKVVDAANKAEEILQPKRADELRMQIVPEFKDPFKFFFFPLSINGDVVTFRAYLDNRDDATKVSRMIKVFKKLPGLVEVNKLWREMEFIKSEEGLVSLNYTNFGTSIKDPNRFIFNPQTGLFVTCLDPRKEPEIPVIPMVGDILYKEFNSVDFTQVGPQQVIKIRWDEKDLILKADIKINNDGVGDKVREALGIKKEMPKIPTEEEMKPYIDVMNSFEQMPKASMEKLRELLPDVSPLFDKEFTFILRPISYNMYHVFQKIPNFKNLEMFNVYVESKSDVKEVNSIIHTFKSMDANANGRFLDVNQFYQEVTLLTEKRPDDIEVKAKFSIIPQKLMSRIDCNEYWFSDVLRFGFGWKFNVKEYEESLRLKSFEPDAYISLINRLEANFDGSRLYSIIFEI